MPLDVGSRLGPYEVAALIGEGGMGAVYGARDTRLNRDVALKVLLPEVANDPERLARFRREAAEAMRRACVPIRSINGDLRPTRLEVKRAVVADVDVVIIPHAGHYPMLEQPEAFDRALESVLRGLPGAPGRSASEPAVSS